MSHTTKETCINCGGWKGLHEWNTGKCPLGGMDCNKYTFTTYQENTERRQLEEQTLFGVPTEDLPGAVDRLVAAAREALIVLIHCDETGSERNVKSLDFALKPFQAMESERGGGE